VTLGLLFVRGIKPIPMLPAHHGIRMGLRYTPFSAMRFTASGSDTSEAR
jgi:hypothetical protein